jgi:hypothetical protein
MNVKPDTSNPSVAILAWSNGLANILKIYSGGLGV